MKSKNENLENEEKFELDEMMEEFEEPTIEQVLSFIKTFYGVNRQESSNENALIDKDIEKKVKQLFLKLLDKKLNRLS